MSTLWPARRPGHRELLVGNVVAVAGEHSRDGLLVDEVLVRLRGDQRCAMKPGDTLNLSIEVEMAEVDGRLTVRAPGWGPKP